MRPSPRRTSLLLAIVVATAARGQAADPSVLAGTGDRPEAAQSGDPARPGQITGPDPAAQTGAPGAVARAEPLTPPAPTWPARGVPPVGTWDIVATGGLTAAALVVQFAIPAPTVPKWTEENGFDNGIRDALRLSSEGGRQAAGLTSDILVFTLMAGPFLNAILVAGVEHERWDVGWRLMVLDAQAILLATTITLSLQKATARQRPYVQECPTNPSLSECSGGGKYQSFPSGHTTAAFAAVTLECFHNGYLDTSHTGWGSVQCPVTIVAALGTGILRIAADKHWATDILVGAAVGGIVGYAVPTLHLLGAEKKDGLVLTPSISASTVGLTLVGRF